MPPLSQRVRGTRAGRDAPNTLAVLAVEGEYLLLADGRRRKVEKPKRKKAIHTAPTGTVLDPAQLKTNKLLRAAIAAYDAAHPI